MTLATVSIECAALANLDLANLRYQPHRPGVELLPETGDPQASLENARLLYRRDAELVGFLVTGPAGVLVPWRSGVWLLATGFQVGGGAKTRALALFMSEAGFGDFTTLYSMTTLLSVGTYHMLPSWERDHCNFAGCCKNSAALHSILAQSPLRSEPAPPSLDHLRGTDPWPGASRPSGR